MCSDGTAVTIAGGSDRLKAASVEVSRVIMVDVDQMSFTTSPEPELGRGEGENVRGD